MLHFPDVLDPRTLFTKSILELVFCRMKFRKWICSKLEIGPEHDRHWERETNVSSNASRTE